MAKQPCWLLPLRTPALGLLLNWFRVLLADEATHLPRRKQILLIDFLFFALTLLHHSVEHWAYQRTPSRTAESLLALLYFSISLRTSENGISISKQTPSSPVCLFQGSSVSLWLPGLLQITPRTGVSDERVTRLIREDSGDPFLALCSTKLQFWTTKGNPQHDTSSTA